MRLNIIVDIDGTDEQQLAMLEWLEEGAREQTCFGMWNSFDRLDLDMFYVSVTEVPERSVRGPATPVPRPPIRVLAWHKNGLDPREVTRVTPDGEWIFLTFLDPDTEFGPFDVNDYTFTVQPARQVR